MDHVQTGDLFATDADAIVHLAGAFDAADVEITEQFRLFQPASTLAFEQALAAGLDPYQVVLTDAGPGASPRWIFHVDRRQDASALLHIFARQVGTIAQVTRRLGIRSIAFPLPGLATPGAFKGNLFANYVKLEFDTNAPDVTLSVVQADHHVAASPVRVETLTCDTETAVAGSPAPETEAPAAASEPDEEDDEAEAREGPKVAYVRVKRADPGPSLQRQRDSITEAFGPIPDELWFQDTKSGQDFNRPGFQAMLEYCRTHPQRGVAGTVCLETRSVFGMPGTDEMIDEMVYLVHRLAEWGWGIKAAFDRPDPNYRELLQRSTEISRRLEQDYVPPPSTTKRRRR